MRFVAGFCADGFGARFLGGAVGPRLVLRIDRRRWGGNAFRHGGGGKNFCHS